MKKFILCILLLASGIARAENNKPDRVVPYKETPQGELRLHIFSPPGHKKTDKTPTAVVFSNVAWTQSAPWSMYDEAAALAQHGITVVIPQIRSKKKSGTDPRASVMDTKSAIRWLRRHPQKYGIDPNRIVAIGGEEGGHLAAATATLDSFNEPDEDTAISCSPQALILFNPLLDTSEKGFRYPLVKDYWDRFSPRHNMQSNMPPTLILLGTKPESRLDNTVKSFQRTMAKNGDQCRIKRYDNQPETFYWKEKRKEASADIAEFLTALGWIKAAE